MDRQILDRTAGFDAADLRAPPESFEGTIDVDGHRIGGIRPRILARVTACGVLLEIELLDRVGLRAIGQPRQKARHRHADVLGIVRIAQRAPRRIVRSAEDLLQVARIGQLLPGFHAEQRRRRRGDERRMRGPGDLRHLAQQFDVARSVIEVVVTDQRAVGLAAELAVFLFVQLLEDRTLVPGRALVLLQRPAEVLLRNVHDANLEHLIAFGVVDEVLQPAPGTLQLLETLVVQDQVDLFAELGIDLGDDGLDRPHDVVGDDAGLAQRLLRQRLDRVFDLQAGPVGLGLEFLLQQRGELVGLERGAFGLFLLGFGHVLILR